MKMFKGFRVTWSDGTTWYGNCPKWADKCKAAGHKVERAMIMGKTWQCGCSVPPYFC